MLKNLRIKIFPYDRESRITGLSEYVCKQQRLVRYIANSSLLSVSGIGFIAMIQWLCKVSARG